MRFLYLGPARVEVEAGRPAVFRRRKPQLLLAVLLMRRERAVPTHELVRELWGDNPPRSARANLHSYLSSLRTLLADPDAARLSSGPDGYRVELCGGELDVAEFEGLTARAREAAGQGRPGQAAELYTRALGLWRGDAFASMAPSRLLRAETDRLEELRLTVEDEAMDARLAAGAHAQAVGEFRERVKEQPFREHRWGALMLALYRSGRTKEALDAYRALHALLDTELGVTPTGELRQLHQAVLSRDPAIAGEHRPRRSAVPV
ncbi:BTAD domain-containing putative transcriptional regulator [Streptomyces sp. NPDC020607]|uniref:AfsR/SARP family transcriptional regulator n=1 Tax=Streptomyces sp. NPDC020607 TaxID=3365082 RepID=UPI003792F40B